MNGHTYQTADLAALVSAVVGTDGIDADEALAFRFSGIGARTAWAFDGNGQQRPRQRIPPCTT